MAPGPSTPLSSLYPNQSVDRVDSSEFIPYMSHTGISFHSHIQYSLTFLPGLVVGRLFDLGYFRSIFFCSSVLLVVATFLIAQCTQYWQFLLCQGFAIGVHFLPTVSLLLNDGISIF